MTARVRWLDAALGATGALGLFLLWEAAARIGLVSPNIFPAPTLAIVSTLQEMPLADILGHVGASVQRVVLGFAFGAALGILIGITSGWYKALGVLTRPLIEVFRPIPPLAWIPLAIIWFGLGEPSKVFVIFLGAFFPMVTNAYKGMTGIDPMLLRAAQTMGLKGPALLFRVAIPAALPDLATGIRVGWGLSFGVLVAAELIAAEKGMGFMIMNARQLGEVGVVVFGIILIGLVNLVTDYAIGELIRRRMGRWHAV
ncbi:MAG: ABC transporter permease [Alphaproteobacteria bacterium]